MLVFASKAQKKSINTFVLFQSNEKELSWNNQEKLKNLLDSLKDFQIYEIEIKGHTDTDGRENYNEKLSKDRTQAVKQFFLSKQIPEFTISIAFFGEKSPIASNKTEQGKAKNRRVEISIVYDFMIEATEDAPIVDKSTIWDFYKQTEIQAQVFCIQPNKDTILRCKQGTLLLIAANSFKINDFSDNENCLEIYVKEVFQKSDMLLENLTTSSNGHIIESQGMFLINAKYKGKETSLQPGKEILTIVPADSINPEAKLFDAKKENENTNWVLDENRQLNNFTLQELRNCNRANLIFGSSSGGGDCPLFLCKLKKLFAPKKYNRNHKHKSNRNKKIEEKRLQNITADNFGNCSKLKQIFEKYEVKNLLDLQKAIENGIENKTTNFEELKFYAFGLSNSNWKNIDVFMKMNQNLLTSIKINLKPTDQIDVKLIFTKKNATIYSVKTVNNYLFRGIPKRKKAWLVALKYQNETPYLAMEEITITNKSYDLNFVETTLPELKQKLKLLN